MADKTPVFWTTADGRKINVDDMDDNHVRNAFKQLLRKIHSIQKERVKKELRDSFMLHGEMAIASIQDQEMDDGPGDIGWNGGEFYKE